MDIRTLRNKKSKSRNARPYDRPNQSLLGKVASKVKGILYPSWLSTWMSSGEQDNRNDPPEESADEEDVQQVSIRGSKRPRLRLHDHSPIMSEGTQTWLDMPSTSSIFSQGSRMPSTVTQNTLLQNKESAVIMNGDDHSENSEESASTSGCSSLVSHKDRSNCIAGSNLRLRESELENFRGQFKDVIGLNSRQSVTSQNESLSVNVGSSRLSLWSGSGNCSPATNLRCRSPSVVQRNQPSFNVSAFIGPSKLNQSTDGKISSPFYQGRTTFGGASSIRRMPVSVAPYQVDKPLRNQIKVRSNQCDDTLEGMSSAAKRILMTLEKMSSPVTDAKKIPNTNKSPVDLSLYLMPPKHRSNVSTPTGATKGPPIANISTISKLTTLKSCGVRRFQNSSLESLPVPAVERRSSLNDSIQDIMPFASKSGGGKMRNKLTQQHQSSAGHGASEPFESTPLPNIPLPISSLPTFNFDSKATHTTTNAKMSEADFTFSNPIVMLPKQTETLRPSDATDKVAQIVRNTSNTSKGNDENQAFTFARPIELESPFTVPSSANSSNSTDVWECSSCWVRNPSKEPKCLSCKSLKSSLDSAESTFPVTIIAPSNTSNATSTWECNSCWIRNPVKETKCMACEELRPVSSSASVSSLKTVPSGFGLAFTNTPAVWECNSCWIRNPISQAKCLACEATRVSESAAVTPVISLKSAVTNSSTWECKECWIQNPSKEDKCMACETPNPASKSCSGDAAKSLTSSSSSFFGAASSASSGFFSSVTTASTGFKLPSSQNGPQTVSFGGFKIPISKPTDSEEVTDDSSGDKDQPNAVSKTTALESNSVTQSTLNSSSNSKNTKGTDSFYSINGPNVSSLSHKPSKISENVSFDSEKEKTNGTLSFKSSYGSLSNKSTKPTSEFSVSSDWECDVCFVRHSTSTQVCSACETRRLTKKNTSGLRNPDNFKFSSPLQGSPITFKFGTPTTAVTDTTTTTSSGFTFSTPSSTTNNFFASVPSTSIQKSLAESKSLLATEVSSTKLPVPEFKFDAPKLPSSDTAKSSIPVINLIDKTESSGGEKLLDLNEGKTTAPSNVSFAFSASKSSNTNSTISTTTFSIPASTEFNIPKAFVSSNLEMSSDNILQVPDSKKLTENPTSGQSSLPAGGFNFKIPSTVSLGGLSTSNDSLVSKTVETVSDKTTALKQPLPKVSEAGEEKKTVSPFVLSSSTPSVASSFGQSASATSLFGVSDMAPKSSAESSSMVKSCFAVSTTSSTQPTSSFNFNTNSTGAFSFVPSSTSQPSTPAASNLLQFLSGIKNQDVKTVTSVPALSSTLTSSTFTFGDTTATTTQPSVSTGFTFFSQAAAITTTTSSSGSSLFSFNSATQASKPGGFTFKNTTEEKPNPVSSNSVSFGVPTTSTSSSSVFKFGAPAPSSTGGFVFGAVKSEPVSTASSGFSFGSGTVPTTNPSTFSGFQPAQPASAPVFQFGAQPSGGTAPAPQFGAQPSGSTAPVPQFGANSNFSFGTKSETTNPLTQPASGAVAPASGFGGSTMQPMFGNTPALAFGKTDKPGFNFGAAATGAAPVFHFGNVEKKPATTQFSFGTPSQEAATPNSFVPAFNINTPTNFNFGAASPSVQPFQFAASSDSSTNSAHRKIRKAVRRVPPKH